MPRNITQFNLLISCPSDVQEELKIIQETVEDFNRMFGSANNCSILTKHWSKDSYPQSGGKPQSLLNKQFVLDSDVAVAVFWTRFGTPTDNYGSGTEEEIEELLKNGKQVFLYFCDRPINPSNLDSEQYKKILEFKKKYQNEGIYSTYSDLSNFKTDFLNHLTLHFVQLLTNGTTTNLNDASKLSIKGISQGKVTDTPVLYKRNLLETEFMSDFKDKLVQKYNSIKNIKLLKEEILPSKIDNSITKKYSNSLGNLEGVSEKLRGQLSGFNTILNRTRVELSGEVLDQLKSYAEENKIVIDDINFFNIGNLEKQKNIGVPLGPAYYLTGTDEEKEKYNLILDLFDEITKFKQWQIYLHSLSSKYYLNLTLCNIGTTYDEDIDIKIYFKKGKLCKNNQLPIPKNEILEEVNSLNLIDVLFRPRKSLSVIEYGEYPIKANPNVKIPSIYGTSYSEKIESEKNIYSDSIDDLFCYDFFEVDEFDVICFKQSYLKQHTNVLFPSIVVLNSCVDSLYYEISSKHYSEIIKGEIPLKLE